MQTTRLRRILADTRVTSRHRTLRENRRRSGRFSSQIDERRRSWIRPSRNFRERKHYHLTPHFLKKKKIPQFCPNDLKRDLTLFPISRHKPWQFRRERRRERRSEMRVYAARIFSSLATASSSISYVESLVGSFLRSRGIVCTLRRSDL